jgi:hypothetical protein
MSLQTFNKFSHSSCTFSTPVKEDNTYHSTMLNNGVPVFVQLPKLKTINGIHWHDNRCYLDLELTKPVLDFFLNFEKNNIQTTFEKSSKWFGKEMPLDIIESNYISVVRLNSKRSYVRFSIPTTENNNDHQCNINVYNQFKEKIHPEDIIPGTDVWVILRCKGLVVGKRNLCFEWQVEQVKFHTKQGNPYMFIDDEEDTEDVEIMETPFVEEKQFEDYLQG